MNERLKSPYNDDLLQTIGPLEASNFERKSALHSDEKEKITAPSLNFFQDSWRRLKKNRGAMIALFLVMILSFLIGKYYIVEIKIVVAFIIRYIRGFNYLKKASEAFLIRIWI